MQAVWLDLNYKKTFPFSQVHSYYRLCPNLFYDDATCNCGAAVQSGDDVILIDRCGPTVNGQLVHAMTVTAYLNGKLTPGTKVYRYNNGESYRVSRLLITADFDYYVSLLWQNFLSGLIVVTIPEKDWQSVACRWTYNVPCAQYLFMEHLHIECFC